MASNFGARRSENVDALFARVVEKFVGVTVRSHVPTARAPPRFTREKKRKQKTNLAPKIQFLTQTSPSPFTSLLHPAAHHTHAQEEDENHGIAHNYCMYHTRHHSFPDTDPYKVNDALDALRERLGIHAQLEKQEALDTLLGMGDVRCDD